MLRKELLTERLVAIAMYTINKYAKQLRDARQQMKGMLFREPENGYAERDPDSGCDETLLPFQEFLRKAKANSFEDFLIKVPGWGGEDSVYGYGNKAVGQLWDYLFRDNDDSYNREVISLIEEQYQNEYDDLLYDEGYTLKDFIIEYLDDGVIDDRFGNAANELIKKYELDAYREIKIAAKKELAEYERLYELANNWLRDTRYEKDKIYAKKDEVIKRLGLAPVAYHEFPTFSSEYRVRKKWNRKRFGDEYSDEDYENEDYNDYDEYNGYDEETKKKTVFPLYSFGGFLFHTKESMNIKDIPEGLEVKELDQMISAENTLPEAEKMTVDEALEIINEVFEMETPIKLD